MGFYSIYKIIKDIFRTIFGNKALKLIFIILFFVLIIMFFNNRGVFAVSYTSIDTEFFTQSDINTAKNYVGSSNWDNEDYDIILYYTNGRYGTYKAVVYYNINSITSDLSLIKYLVETDSANEPLCRITTFNSSTITWASSNSCKFTILSSGYTNSANTPNFITSSSSNGVIIKPIRSHFNFYNDIGTLLLNATNPIYVSPSIETESSTITNWSFDYLHINSGSETIYYNNVLGDQTTATLYLDYVYNDIRYRYQIPSNLYGINTDNTFDIYIPRTSLLNNVNITNGSNVSFYLGIRKNSEDVFPLGNYTFSLTSAEEEQIQQESDKALQSEILGAQQETNNKLDNIDNTINNSDVEFSSSDLPSDSTQDITSEGVNGIFTSMYNAFCVGNAQDIVFPIPFTNKNITLSATYVSDSLTNSNASFIITIIQAFWWYLISRFIIKDVMDKINKIKGGNIENIETTNIRGDML